MTTQRMKDQATRFAVMVERLKTGLVADLDSAWDSVEREVRRMLADTELSEASRREAEALASSVRSQALRIVSGQTSEALGQLEELGGLSANNGANQVESAGAPKQTVPTSKQVMAEALRRPLDFDGALMEPFLQGVTDRQAQRMANAVRRCWSDGLTNQQAVRSLFGTKARRNKDGELAKAKRETATAIRTATSHVNSTAMQVFMEENDDVVVGFRWVSTLDGSTSSVCRSLDGRRYSLDDQSAPRPPAHPNCRSFTVPDLGEDADWLKEGATRSSADGYVDQSENYYDWLSRQDADFQDEVLGKERGSLFREGGLPPDEFARLNLGRNFQQITLQELKEKMRDRKPQVFEEAEISLSPVQPTPEPTQDEPVRNEPIREPFTSLKTVPADGEAFFKTLDQDQKDTLQNYTADSQIFNSGLRSNQPLRPSVKEDVEKLDAIFEGRPIEDRKLYRVVDEDGFRFYAKEGRWVDPGFTSTTMGSKGLKQILDDFEDVGVDDSITLEISYRGRSVPVNYRQNYFSNQSEAILPRGTTFRIVGRTPEGRILIEAFDPITE